MYLDAQIYITITAAIEARQSLIDTTGSVAGIISANFEEVAMKSGLQPYCRRVRAEYRWHNIEDVLILNLLLYLGNTDNK